MTSGPFNIYVPALSDEAIKWLSEHAGPYKVRLENKTGGGCVLSCAAMEDAYSLLTALVQAAEALIPNHLKQMNSTCLPNSYPENYWNVPTQQMAPSKLLFIAADALALAIAEVWIVTRMQNRPAPVLAVNPALPLKYYLPCNKGTIYLFGRKVEELQPQQIEILKILLAAPVSTLVPQKSLIDQAYGPRGVTSDGWHAQMSYIRKKINPELLITTVKMQGYILSVNTDIFKMSLEQRCQQASRNQLENPTPMEIEAY